MLAANKNLLIAFVVVILGGLGAFLLIPEKANAPEESLTTDGEEVSDTPLPAQIESEEEDEESEGTGGLAFEDIQPIAASTIGPVVFVLKDVGEAYLGRFGLAAKDFSDIKSAGFDVIEGNFDICAEDSDVKFFLDSAHAAGLKVILNAGAGEAEWGYPCDSGPTKDMVPEWQREAVSIWVFKWKDHPALYAWDTSNEDGGTFPFGVGGTDPDLAWETKYALTVPQLEQAYRDVKAWDPAHPVMIRMNGWYFYDYADNFFRPGNAFGKDVADIVMINAYANVDEYIDDFVSTVLVRAARAIGAIDYDTKLLPALGVWEEPPVWEEPTIPELINDYNQAAKSENLLGIGFFKYGAPGSEWYLPDARLGAPELWQRIRELIGS